MCSPGPGPPAPCPPPRTLVSGSQREGARGGRVQLGRGRGCRASVAPGRAQAVQPRSGLVWEALWLCDPPTSSQQSLRGVCSWGWGTIYPHLSLTHELGVAQRRTPELHAAPRGGPQPNTELCSGSLGLCDLCKTPLPKSKQSKTFLL